MTDPRSRTAPVVTRETRACCRHDFGDLFLRDIRAYREKQLEGSGLQPIFPLWEMPTRALAEEMIASGLKAKLTCVDPKHLNKDFE